MATEKTKKPTLVAVPDVHTPAPGREAEACPKCFGSGLEVVPGKGARACECRRKDAQSELLRRAKLPKRYEQCHINNYWPQNPSQDRAAGLAAEFSMKYPSVEAGLLFVGTVGVGKTHLAVSILKGLTERGFPCLFYEFGTLLKEIQDSYNPDTRASELSVLSPVLETEVLVLDELGATKPTNWVRDTMAHVINSRYNDKKVTIFTTNFADIRPSEKEETLADRIGERLRSRLYEMCTTVMMTGTDYRQVLGRRPKP